MSCSKPQPIFGIDALTRRGFKAMPHGVMNCHVVFSNSSISTSDQIHQASFLFLSADKTMTPKKG
jgi:hypothetical protein